MGITAKHTIQILNATKILTDRSVLYITLVLIRIVNDIPR